MKTIKKLCQAMGRMVLAISMVFGTGICGVFADELNPNSTNLDNALAAQSALVNNLTTNRQSINNALDLLADAQELDGNDPDTLIGHIDYIIQNTGANSDLEILKTVITDAQNLHNVYNTLTPDELLVYNDSFNQLILDDYTNSGESYESLANYYAVVITTILDVGLDDANANVTNNASNNDLNVLTVNGLDLITYPTETVYVGYEVENLEVIASATYGSVVIEKPDVLALGNNTVKIIVTSLDGQAKEYVINVIRQDASADQGDPADETESAKSSVAQMNNTETNDEATVKTLASTTDSTYKSTDTEKKEKTKNKKDTKKYDEEVEKEKGLNGLTVLLIVGGIALIGFGIYMLFGDKDDDIPSVKEVKTPKKTNATSKTKKVKNNKPKNKI